MFKNHHVITAMLVTPILAILAWFAVGTFVGEKPQPPQSGEVYPLVEKSSCRYASGLCELENNDLRLTLRFDDSAAAAMVLEASHDLESVLLSVASPEGDPGPRAMVATDDSGQRWRLLLAAPPGPRDRLRLVLSRRGTAYYAEASTAFLQPEHASQ